MFDNFQPYSEPENCGVILPKIKVSKEELSSIDDSLTEESSSYDILKALVKKGLREKGITSWHNRQQYYDRAKQELETFDELGFTDYVLLNWDILKFCHENDIPLGFARGSCAGSLVLFLVRVTNVDPIANNLFFERFVSKSRAKKIYSKSGEEFLLGSLLPDVDTDISYEKRHLVIKYIEDKHKGRTAKILTFNTFSSKLCIREASKYFCEYNESQASEISDLIPKLHGVVEDLDKAYNESPKFKDWADKNPLAYKNALKIVDLNKNSGQHPSGICICSELIDDVIPLQKTKEGEIISGYDMGGVSDLMVKFDILGLRTLTVAHNTCKKLGIKLEDIDVHDPFIYQILQDFRHPMGIFQLGAEVNKRVCQQARPASAEELSDVLALARPASLQFVDAYVEQKKNPIPLGLHKELDELLLSSKNVFLYQETILQCLHKVFKFPLEDAESLRRSISKKVQKEVDAWKEKIFEAAIREGISEESANYFWSAVEAAGAYSFNKCIFEEEEVEFFDGERVKLKDCKIGDFIKAFSPVLEKNEFVQIKNIYHNTKPVYEVKLENGKTIRTSIDHKFLCDNGEMVALKDIVGSSLRILSL
jgi:DNA polymerase III subunit alpha